MRGMRTVSLKRVGHDLVFPSRPVFQFLVKIRCGADRTPATASQNPRRPTSRTFHEAVGALEQTNSLGLAGQQLRGRPTVPHTISGRGGADLNLPYAHASPC